MAQLHQLSSSRLLVTISTLGAELQSLRAPDGREFLSQGDPSVWAERAPNLFPIVGELKDDTLVHEGRRYPIGRHGFARKLDFRLETATASGAVFLLTDSADTWAHYPFAFELRLEFTLQANVLEINHRLGNPGETPLYASLGGHPAFVWPLAPGVPREAHVMTFAAEEPAPIRRLAGRLLAREPVPSPVQGRTLRLRDALFTQDALIFDRLVSRSVTYSAPGAPAIHVEFPDFPHLGIWTKPGAGYVCIEPWQGYASPEDFAGEFRDKPGVVAVAGGEERSWRYSIRIDL